MAKFLTKLKLELADNSDSGRWIVVEQFLYQSDIVDTLIIVPRGFPTDLASIPRIPIIYELVGNTSIKASVIHDFLYTSHLLSRKQADAILKEASVVAHTPAWRREIIWLGARIFGWHFW